MVVGINGAAYACDIEWEYYSANVVPASTGTPGQPPYTYQWRWNTTGEFSSNNPGYFLSSYDHVNVGSLACPHFYLNLQVTSNDGVIVNAIKKINTKKCEECQDPENGFTTGLDRAENDLVFANISPNPTNGEAFLLIKSEKGRGSFSFYITNSQGALISQSITYLIKSGSQKVSLPVADLPAGLYFCTIQLNGRQVVQKLVLTD